MEGPPYNMGGPPLSFTQFRKLWGGGPLIGGPPIHISKFQIMGGPPIFLAVPRCCFYSAIRTKLDFINASPGIKMYNFIDYIHSLPRLSSFYPWATRFKCSTVWISIYTFLEINEIDPCYVECVNLWTCKGRSTEFLSPANVLLSHPFWRNFPPPLPSPRGYYFFSVINYCIFLGKMMSFFIYFWFFCKLVHKPIFFLENSI